MVRVPEWDNEFLDDPDPVIELLPRNIAPIKSPTAWKTHGRILQPS
jgi:hypothetical protein